MTPVLEMSAGIRPSEDSKDADGSSKNSETILLGTALQ